VTWLFCVYGGTHHEYLDTFGIIRIAVPDAYHPSGYVKELTKPGGSKPGADDHKVFIT
jgi:hypothetical protein